MSVNVAYCEAVLIWLAVATSLDQCLLFHHMSPIAALDLAKDDVSFPHVFVPEYGRIRAALAAFDERR